MVNYLLAAVMASLALSGCISRAGPFVTSISSDGDGGLVVEKCMAQFDPWMSTVANDQCSTHKIQIGSSARQQNGKNDQ